MFWPFRFLRIASKVIILLGIFLIVSYTALVQVAAQSVSFSEDTTVTITVGGSSINLRIPAGSLVNEFIVNASSLEITKGSAGGIAVISSDRIELVNDKGLQTKCESGISKLEITVEAKIIITPTSNTEYCSSATGGGGSGGSTGGTVAATTPSETPETPETPPKKEPMFKDIGSLKESDQKKILQIAELMLEQKTYKVPAAKKYSPNLLTRGSFAIQIWNAAAGIGCGSDKEFPGITACKKKAVEEKFIPDAFATSKKVMRLTNYEVLLKARNIPLDKTFTADDLEEVCSDVKKGTKKMAQVYFTARANGIAVKYKGNKCKLSLGFSKKEAAHFAVKALAAKAKSAEE